MKKKILFLIVLMFLLNIRVYSLTYGGCDYSTVSRLKSLVTNINISYNYRTVDNQPYFDVTLNNITPDMYFKDTLTNTTYTYNDTQNGEITLYNYNGVNGSYKFYSALDACYGISLGTKYYKFPTYNIYYNDPLCSDIPNYSLCQKWVYVNYSQDEFERVVLEYKNGSEVIEEQKPNVEYEKTIIDVIVEIYVNYYYYFLIAIILICSIIIIVNNRKNKFKL